MASGVAKLPIWAKTPIDSGKQQVRVLVLNPGSNTDKIVCDMTVVSLDDKPTFNALSYVWGDTGSTKAITVNNQAVLVTSNLFEALQHVRYRMGCNPDEILSSPLWVDAICINQQDLDERSQQVRLMTQIYAQAHRVVVWLGPGDQYSDWALAVCVQDKFLVGIRDLASGTRSEPNRDEARVAIILDRNIKRREWWQRVWVLQEFILATQEPLVLCGKLELTWTQLKFVFDTLGFLTEPGYAHFLAEHQDVPLLDSHGISSVSAWTTMRERYREIGHLSTTMPFIAASKHRATNPKDYLYGVLGVLRDNIRMHLPVDYTSTDHEVFRQAAIAAFTYDQIKYLGNAILLLRFHPRLPDLPSWAADLTQQFQDYKKPNYEEYAIGLSEPDALPFKSPNATVVAGGWKLSISGIKIDRIVHVHKLFIPNDQEVFSLQAHLRVFGEGMIVAKLARKFPVPQSSPLFPALQYRDSEGPFSALLARSGFGPMPQPDRMLIWHLLEGKTTEAELEKRLSTTTWSRLYERTLKAIMHSLYKRVVIVTDNGLYGPANPNAQVGDYIVMLYGMTCPMILRPMPDAGGYEMVGFARVSGFTDMQAVLDLDAKGHLAPLETVFNIY